MNQPQSDGPRQPSKPGPATLAAAIRRRQAAAAAAKAAATTDADPPANHASGEADNER